MNDKHLIKADFYVSLLLMFFSLFIVTAGLFMPKYESWGYYAMPSMSPVFFGSVLFFMSLILFSRSFAKKGYKINVNRGHLKIFLEAAVVRRFSACLGLVVLYYALLGTVNFVVLTAAFLFGNIFYFKGARWRVNLVISLSTAFCVWFVFYEIFMVPLP